MKPAAVARKAREDVRLKEIFDLPRVAVTLKNIDTKFGYAYVLNSYARWTFMEGTLPYLIGYKDGMNQMLDNLDIEDDDFLFVDVFLELNNKGVPKGVCESITIPQPFESHFGVQTKKKPLILDNLIDIEYQGLPPFIIE